MITVNIRKQGGAVIITIPSDVLKMLDIDIGTTLELDVTKNEFIARPLQSSVRKRYKLAELLRGTSPKKMKTLNKSVEWLRKSKAVGRELT